MAPPILKLDDIFLSFGGAPLLNGANLQIEPGDRICLVGRNGSGKSTLMKIAAGMVEAQSGEVFRHPSSTVRYLEQAPDFGAYTTVQAYAEAGLGPGDDPYRVTYLLEHLGLTGQEEPSSLSGGEARRAARAVRQSAWSFKLGHKIETLEPKLLLSADLMPLDAGPVAVDSRLVEVQQAEAVQQAAQVQVGQKQAQAEADACAVLHGRDRARGPYLSGCRAPQRLPARTGRTLRRPHGVLQRAGLVSRVHGGPHHLGARSGLPLHLHRQTSG